MSVSIPPDFDAVFVHCDLARLQNLVLEIEARHPVQITRQPSICLTMIRAEDSLEHQPFFLGEALTTECEVQAGGVAGFGICLGEDPSRAYCLAVLDAVREAGIDQEIVSRFAAEQAAILEERNRREFARVMRTKVDFKLLEQE
jgi:alpha-D-ribose 1-methylphosphonate 5-triphosphate synthase subunit PhnG